MRVDFGSCNCLELSETCRSFVDLCLGTQVNRALLKAGDNAEGHRQLREVVRTAAIRPAASGQTVS